MLRFKKFKNDRQRKRRMEQFKIYNTGRKSQNMSEIKSSGDTLLYKFVNPFGKRDKQINTKSLGNRKFFTLDFGC